MPSDLRFACRQLTKAPRFAATIVFTLALAIGGCVTVFSVVNAVILHPLNYAEPERLVNLQSVWAKALTVSVSPADYLDWQAQAKSFSGIAASRSETFSVASDKEPISLSTRAVTANFFDVRGVTAMVGRTFAAGEDRASASPTIVLSYPLWQRLFGGATDVVGKTIRLNEQPYTVIGVMGSQLEVNGHTDAWTALRWTDSDLRQRKSRFLTVVGRLNPGVTLAQAQAEMDVLTAQSEEANFTINKDMSAKVSSMVEAESRDVRALLWSLLGTIGCVLLIGCANIANLQLARTVARAREFAVRAALGASRIRIITQLLLESLVLALLGGGIGVLLTLWSLDLLRSMADTVRVSRLRTVELDGTMLGFALALTVATGVLFGLAPAWLGSQVKLQEALKHASRSATDGRQRRWLRQGLVIFEVAAALMLLAGAGLLTRSFARLTQAHPGVVTERAIAMTVQLPAAKYNSGDKRRAFIDEMLPKLQALPGVTSAAATNVLPLQRTRTFADTMIEGRPWKVANDSPVNLRTTVTPNYFSTAGIRLLRGRLFTADDRAGAPLVVVISEQFAREMFPGEDPIGKRMHFFEPNAAWREIVGVVNDVMISSGDVKNTPQVYEPHTQGSPGATVRFLLRTSVEPASLFAAARAQVYAIEKDQAISSVRTLENMFDENVGRQRFGVGLLGAFSLLALLIAVVGIYGVIAYSVSQRTPEIGIRMALGAQATDVLRLVMLQGTRLLGMGIFLGISGALAAGRLLQAQLFETEPNDPLTLGCVAALLALAAAFACLIPARRAAKVDPVVALRSE